MRQVGLRGCGGFVDDLADFATAFTFHEPHGKCQNVPHQDAPHIRLHVEGCNVGTQQCADINDHGKQCKSHGTPSKPRQILRLAVIRRCQYNLLHDPPYVIERQ